MSRMHFLGEAYDAHRAYGDVLATEKFFTTNPFVLVLSLSNLTIRSVICMMSIYHDKVQKKKETDKLFGELKSEGTANLAMQQG